MTLPPLALSIRQPWAWAIIDGGKRLENRSPGAVKHMTYRGPICIHASLGMTQDEYMSCADFMWTLNIKCPEPGLLQRGGIIGTARVVDVIKDCDDPWFFGPRALVLTDVKPVAFMPCKGALGFFKWVPYSADTPDAPKRWMLPKTELIDTKSLPFNLTP